MLERGWGAFFHETLTTLVDQAGRRGFSVSIQQGMAPGQSLETGLKKVMETQARVLVIGTWETWGDHVAQLITSLPVPVILINRHLSAVASAVTLDDYNAGAMAARYLADLGHKHIAYLPGSRASSPMCERLRGFQAVLQDRGLFRAELFTAPLTGNILEWACAGANALLSLAAPPTAIWTCSDLAASAVLVAAKTRGISTPAQLSVMGFDNNPEMRDIGLTTFDFRLQELGQHTAHLAEGFLKGHLTGQVQIKVMPQLVVGVTTGPVPLDA